MAGKWARDHGVLEWDFLPEWHRVEAEDGLSRNQRMIEVGSPDLVVRRLVERGLIYRATRGTYDFALPGFRPYIRRRAADLSNVSLDEIVGDAE